MHHSHRAVVTSVGITSTDCAVNRMAAITNENESKLNKDYIYHCPCCSSALTLTTEPLDLE